MCNKTYRITSTGLSKMFRNTMKLFSPNHRLFFNSKKWRLHPVNVMPKDLLYSIKSLKFALQKGNQTSLNYFQLFIFNFYVIYFDHIISPPQLLPDPTQLHTY